MTPRRRKVADETERSNAGTQTGMTNETGRDPTRNCSGAVPAVREQVADEADVQSQKHKA